MYFSYKCVAPSTLELLMSRTGNNQSATNDLTPSFPLDFFVMKGQKTLIEKIFWPILFSHKNLEFTCVSLTKRGAKHPFLWEIHTTSIWIKINNCIFWKWYSDKMRSFYIFFWDKLTMIEKFTSLNIGILIIKYVARNE